MDSEFESITVVVGGNDCSSDRLIPDIRKNCDKVIKKEKSMCQGKVAMSSICPRLDTVDVQRKIELTNTAFKNLCDTHRVHLTWQASNKLALNLKLKTTEKCVSLHRSRGRPRQTRCASNYRRSDVNQTRPTEREYNGLKHSQKDERQNQYYRHDFYHHRGNQNREDHQILRQSHQQRSDAYHTRKDQHGYDTNTRKNTRYDTHNRQCGHCWQFKCECY